MPKNRIKSMARRSRRQILPRTRVCTFVFVRVDTKMKLLSPLFDESTHSRFLQLLPNSSIFFTWDFLPMTLFPLFCLFCRFLLKILLDNRAQSIHQKHIFFFPLLFSCSIGSFSNRKAIACDIYLVNSSVEYPARTPMLFHCCSSPRLIPYGVLVCSDILSLKNSRVISQSSSAKLIP